MRNIAISILTYTFISKGEFWIDEKKFLYQYFAGDIYLSRFFVYCVCSTMWKGIEENKSTFPGSVEE